MGCLKLLAEGGMTGGHILILKVGFGRGLLMGIQIQSNKKNNKPYLQKSPKISEEGDKRHFIYLFFFIYLILKAI